MVTDCLDRDAVIAGTVRLRAILRRAYVALVVRVRISATRFLSAHWWSFARW
jgi:hypothetical protein